MAGKNKYTEPIDYIPKEIQRKNKVGAYSDVYKKDAKQKPKKTKKTK